MGATCTINTNHKKNKNKSDKDKKDGQEDSTPEYKTKKIKWNQPDAKFFIESFVQIIINRTNLRSSRSQYNQQSLHYK